MSNSDSAALAGLVSADSLVGLIAGLNFHCSMAKKTELKISSMQSALGSIKNVSKKKKELLVLAQIQINTHTSTVLAQIVKSMENTTHTHTYAAYYSGRALATRPSYPSLTQAECLSTLAAKASFMSSENLIQQ